MLYKIFFLRMWLKKINEINDHNSHFWTQYRSFSWIFITI